MSVRHLLFATRRLSRLVAMTEIPPGGNLFARLPRTGTDEDIAALLTTPNVRIERIVSTGQASPPGFWWDQEWAEWVVLLTGSAGLRFEGETELRELKPGDPLNIEVDIMAKYVEKMLEEKHASSTITLERLEREGF